MARFSFKPEPHGLGFFDPAGRFVARRPFVFNGREVARGDELPIAEAGEGRMRRLHNARYVSCEPAPLPPPAEAPRPAPAPTPVFTAAVNMEPDPAPYSPPAEQAPAPIAVRTLDMRGAILAPPDEKRTGARPPRKPRQGGAPAADAPQPPPSAPAQPE